MEKPARTTKARAKPKPAQKTGRPTKLTPALQARVVKAVAEGNYGDTAAEAAGIDRGTFCRWMRRGRDGEEPYAAFAEAIACARAKAETKLVRTVNKSGAPGAQWLLERTRPKRFSARVNVKVESELSEFLDVAERTLSSEDYLRLLERFDEHATAVDTTLESDGLAATER